MSTPRPPIVSVLGHVDHGKTSLLDALRKSRVVTREAGGITQSIGASVVTDSDGKTITFIDTPGHAAFNKMRSRGANVCDIALLVVAADDGVKPQTIEALKFIREAETPYIVVFTKVDLPNSQVEIALGQLEKEGVLFEGRGGEVPYLEVSAKTNKGLPELLEMIVLVGEVAEITGNKDGKLVAQVIETAKEKRGPLVSVVVKQGTLRITDMLYFEGGEAKVRGLFSATGESVKEVLPGYPVQILGFSELPKVGSVLVDEQSATGEVQVKKNESQRKDFDLSIVLKAESAGSLEAVLESLPPGVVSLQSTVGELAESDVSFAKDAGCDVFVFESKVGTQVKRLADTEGVTIYEFAIIYELLDSLKEIVESGREKVLGEAEILKSFPYNDKIVAGSKVKKGSIAKGKVLVVMRGEVEVGRVKIASLKKNKLDVPAVSQGEEFGVILTPQLAFERGDVLLSVEN